ncbi:PREDICTED: transcription factor Adf-1-like isoform X2 [Rhagoletis zephyria]|uniref:transcription factor Adf-1-like isoform X2 n=1 Tax=Rhagoletis zephyria TaxID=28612 RepID=UPI0008116D90|nr:PREDICTED: transcription factor Adf-1-like isoform X2 [Rhagoletis zephyria]XP_017471637.1 PREDICTED: transcription factor Adf-1-like isoform X2 [Rhagoletis zephyria]
MEEKLIEAIKMQPCLFDKSSNLFRNKYLKEWAWQAVAASVGVSEEHCRNRWKSLRDRFVREVAANRPKSGDAANYKPEWCFMDAMRFLTKHIAPRRTISNLDFDDDQPSYSNSPQIPHSESGDGGNGRVCGRGAHYRCNHSSRKEAQAGGRIARTI